MSFAFLMLPLVEMTMLMSTGGSGCLQAPVIAPIDARFEAPACPYCAGRRTIDFAVDVGTEVVAPISGAITFAGVVAGTGYITIVPMSGRHAEFDVGEQVGERTTPGHLVTVGAVEPLPDIRSGAFVTAGQRIGSAASGALRLSVRRVVEGGPAEYLDPEPSLARWRGPVRLIPDPNSPAPAPRSVRRVWSCRRPL